MDKVSIFDKDTGKEYELADVIADTLSLSNDESTHDEFIQECNRLLNKTMLTLRFKVQADKAMQGLKDGLLLPYAQKVEWKSQLMNGLELDAVMDKIYGEDAAKNVFYIDGVPVASRYAPDDSFCVYTCNIAEIMEKYAEELEQVAVAIGKSVEQVAFELQKLAQQLHEHSRQYEEYTEYRALEKLAGEYCTYEPIAFNQQQQARKELAQYARSRHAQTAKYNRRKVYQRKPYRHMVRSFCVRSNYH